MSGPWDKYAQQPQSSGPWTKYAQPEVAASAGPDLNALRAQNTQNDAHFGGKSISAAPPLLSKAGLKKAFFESADKITNLLPAGAGIAGGLAGTAGGPLGATAGATIGGAGGEAARQLSRRALGFETPDTSSEASENIGIEGLKQGAYELGGQGFGRMGKAIAPKLAEAAVAPGKRLLKSIPEDVNIGKTILQDSKGFSPKSVAKSLGDKIASDSSEVDRLATDASNRGAKMSLAPARGLVARESASAAAKNAPGYIRDVQTVGDQLAKEQAGANAGRVIPSLVDPVRGRALRQGVDLTIGSWNPEAQSAIRPLKERAYGALTDEFHKAVPGSGELDRRMTRMIPAKEAAWNTSFNPGVTRNVVEKLARPTGALIGSVAGAKAGYDQGGVGGAVIGGLTGLALPAYATSPSGLMTGARLADSQIPARLLRYSVPVIEGQMGRSKDKRASDGEDEK